VADVYDAVATVWRVCRAIRVAVGSSRVAVIVVRAVIAELVPFIFMAITAMGSSACAVCLASPVTTVECAVVACLDAYPDESVSASRLATGREAGVAGHDIAVVTLLTRRSIYLTVTADSLRAVDVAHDSLAPVVARFGSV
jgi:hypothetical protein